jgi:glycosyltransferase involved in cell wall biosynthesis
MAAPVHRIPPSQRKGSDQVLKRLGISGATPILLYIGRLLELKHADDAVRVMAETISKHPSAAGVLAGTGPMLTQLQDLARSLGVEESIHFAGQLDQESLSLLIPRCIIVSPHTGLALIECGLGGAPVVAYDRDWQPEFIQDGVNGFIVPFRDHRAMAQRVDEIVRDHELAHRLSVAMRARAERHIDPEEVKRLEWGAFAGVLDRWSSSNSRRG